jgi:hypothetical protein
LMNKPKLSNELERYPSSIQFSTLLVSGTNRP